MLRPLHAPLVVNALANATLRLQRHVVPAGGRAAGEAVACGRTGDVVRGIAEWSHVLTLPRCDADPDVLADYVLALFKYDSGDEELISMLNEQLVDFLEDRALRAAGRPY